MLNRENRILAKFKDLTKRNECALICYTVAGYPDIQTSKQIINSLVKGGADIIEIGIPFSDPIADGPTIQEASHYALEKNGITPSDALELAKNVSKEHPELPILVMTYFNILINAGLNKFMRRAKESHIDGLILPDLSIEESKMYYEIASNFELSTVFLVSPNTSKTRVEKIIENTSGFLYLVSVYGVTGARKSFADYTINAIKRVKRIAAGSNIPVGVGFGISTPAHVRLMASLGADAVIVASAIIDRVSKYHSSSSSSNKKEQLLQELRDYTSCMKGACRKRKRKGKPGQQLWE
jgi:tryptophan synthase alpha chain